MSRIAFLQEVGIARAVASVALVFLTVVVLVSIPSVNLVIAWSGDPTLNTAICTAGGDQGSPVAVGDGYSGTIIAWQDYRSGTDWDIYSQRVDPTGAVQWSGNGKAICTASSDQISPAAVTDGHGGAIIAWQDSRGSNYDIYAQRIDPAGVVLWTANGVPICTASYDQVSPRLVSDGSGGAIVIWEDKRSGLDYNIYAQKIGTSGTTQWTSNGVAVCQAASDQTSVTAVGDTDGGTIVAWQDQRNGNYDIYAQRVDSSCDPLWTANGVSICAAAWHQISPVIVEDGSGGAIIAWQDGRSDANYDVYGQRVNSAGATRWTINGVPICTAADDQSSLSAISDGIGGAIIAWQDARNSINYDIYSQRVDSTGYTRWTTNGVPVGTAPEDQRSPIMVSGNSSGAIIAWRDARSSFNYDIYGQSVDSTGGAQWTPNGVPICTAAEDQGSLSAASDGSGGAIVTWQDSRNITKDIYAQRVQASGVLSHPPYQPSNLSPADRAEGVVLTPTLKCSVFSPAESGDTHVASQWRMTTTAGEYSGTVFDSGPDSFGLLQVTLDSGRLNGNTTYYWQVKHQGNNGLWSPWSVETSFTTLNRPPNQPQGVWPQNGASGISLTPTLQSSAFSDPDGDNHAASQWQIATTPGDYSSPAFLSPELTSDPTQITIDSPLAGHTTHYWRVRHKDNRGGWSAWSEERSFTTLNRPPDRPAPVSPPAGTTGTSLSPTLESTVFSDPDSGDTHAASQWQITTKAGDYGSPIFDNAHAAGSSLTSIAVLTSNLSPSTTYHWRVRYQDNRGAWSDWSEESYFATQSTPPDNPPVAAENHPPDRPTCVAPEDSATSVNTTPTLEASAFHDPDIGDSQAASQWQITTKAGDFGSPIFDNAHVAGSSLTSIAVDGCSLNPSTTYYWRVRYQDNRGAWSDWSDEAAFTTQSSPPVTTENHPPDRPVCVAPEDGARNVSATPTLEASDFHDPDVGDSQAASQWQITTTPGDYQDPVVDRVESLNSATVSAKTLSLDTTYSWRVRYQDNQGAWSDWSEEVSFKTEAEGQGAATNRMGAASWIYLAGIAAVALLIMGAVAWRNGRAAKMATQ